MLLSAVLLQEAARSRVFVASFWWLEEALGRVAELRGMPPLGLLERVRIAAAAGLGHGAAHAVFFFLSISSPALGSATLYSDLCPDAPFFLVAASLSSAFSIIHAASTVTCVALSAPEAVGKLLSPGAALEDQGPPESQQLLPGAELVSLHGQPPRPVSPSGGEAAVSVHGDALGPARRLLVPAVHILAAASTLLNLSPQGCKVGVPLVWLWALVSVVVCAKSLSLVRKQSLWGLRDDSAASSSTVTA